VLVPNCLLLLNMKKGSMIHRKSILGFCSTIIAIALIGMVTAT
jgi:hypothetical protein